MSGGGSAGPEVARALAGALTEQRLRIVASLIRTTGDWDLAEDAVSDAAESALRHWPRDGVPDHPAAWLTTTARRRALDVLRRARTERTKREELAARDASQGPASGPTSGSQWDDDRLRLLFTCCHPALPLEGRVALTCKVVAGLSTAAVARAFLVPEATMGQRLLRAKQKIAHAGIPYRVPEAEHVDERLEGVLAVVYLLFTTGWAAADDDLLAAEAVRLGRLLVALVPRSEEARGLLALMLLQHARRPARLVDGRLVTLEHQDRSRWDATLMREGQTLLRAAAGPRGPYRLQAELAAVHSRAATPADTDWPAIVRLYDELLEVHHSPVVSLNRAVALGMARGPAAGLEALDELAGQRVLAGSHLVPAVRGDLLARAGRDAEAVRALDQAARLAPTEQERRALARRRDELGGLSRG